MNLHLANLARLRHHGGPMDAPLPARLLASEWPTGPTWLLALPERAALRFDADPRFVPSASAFDIRRSTFDVSALRITIWRADPAAGPLPTETLVELVTLWRREILHEPGPPANWSAAEPISHLPSPISSAAVPRYLVADTPHDAPAPWSGIVVMPFFVGLSAAELDAPKTGDTVGAILARDHWLEYHRRLAALK
jgi:hypothetical protein